jgi:uncharacterized protein YciI
MHFLLFYDYAPDYLERRGEFRAEHLRLAWEAAERGELVLAVALGDPVDTGVMLFSADSPAPIERLVAADPYVKHRIVTGWRIRPWTTVVGAAAATPVRP